MTGELHTIDVEHALKSKKFSSYLTQVAEIEKVNLMNLSIPQRTAFFLNIYQCMYIHYFLKTVHESCKAKCKKGTVCSQVLSYWCDQPAKIFFYNIAGQNFTLEDIKHGLLRSNKPKPGSYFKHVNTNDHRLYFLP